MRRRDFIAGLSVATAVAPLAARAQSERVRRIGVLSAFGDSDPNGQRRTSAFEKALRGLGWTRGKNIEIDYRWAAGDADRARRFARELVDLRPDVVMCVGTASLAALHDATQIIPIVFTSVSDPVGMHVTTSEARPSGNVTGFINFEPSMAGKWLEVLKEIAPRIRRAALLYNPDTAPYIPPFLKAVESIAASIAVETIRTPIHTEGDIQAAIDKIGQEPGGGLVVFPEASTVAHRRLIISLAARDKVPAVYPFGFFAAEGGLAAYGVDLMAQYSEAAAYTDRLLRGAKVAELPIQAPTKFELVINLKTAKALGIDVPPRLQQLADEVIE